MNYLEYAGRAGLAGADDVHDMLSDAYPGRRARRTTPTPPPTP